MPGRRGRRAQAGGRRHPGCRVPGGRDLRGRHQWCADSIVQRPVGGLGHPQINWQNRPTYQQVTEFAAHR
ncbi:hypothetical protein [Streptomyces avidinii]|uniref:Uncharacterized protein n=1 Tax=Streptomyces avidinii TaxID=1895 RepID=A0ABS4KZA8_STRAV|nr:hypothetical protein [Streptomyces avidinii]MBP2035368.1 hypothetical protein [Streptomyces avidinii]